MGASESKEGMCGGECDIERVCDTKKTDKIVTVGKVRGVEASGMRDRSPRNLEKQQQQQQHAQPPQQANQEISNNVMVMESNGHEAKTCRPVPQIPSCMRMTHQLRMNGQVTSSRGRFAIDRLRRSTHRVKPGDDFVVAVQHRGGSRWSWMLLWEDRGADRQCRQGEEHCFGRACRAVRGNSYRRCGDTRALPHHLA